MDGEAHKLLAEVHQLITEQSEALRDKITPRTARFYAGRARKLGQLLDRLRQSKSVGPIFLPASPIPPFDFSAPPQ
jgi:hypothetical protein